MYKLIVDYLHQYIDGENPTKGYYDARAIAQMACEIYRKLSEQQ